MTFCGGFDECIERHVSVMEDAKRKQVYWNWNWNWCLAAIQIIYKRYRRFPFPCHSVMGSSWFWWSGPKRPLGALVFSWSPCHHSIKSTLESWHGIKQTQTLTFDLLTSLGRGTTTGTWQSSPQATTGRRRPRTAWRPTRLPTTSRQKACHPHTPSASAWRSTSPFSTTRSSTHRTAPASRECPLSLTPSFLAPSSCCLVYYGRRLFVVQFF